MGVARWAAGWAAAALAAMETWAAAPSVVVRLAEATDAL